MPDLFNLVAQINREMLENQGALPREGENRAPRNVTSTGVTREQYLERVYSAYDQILGFPTGTTMELFGTNNENPALDQLVDFARNNTNG